MPRLAWYSHEVCFWHDPGQGSGYVPVGPGVEPLRQFAVDPDLRRAEGLVKATGVMDHFTQLTPAPATDAELALVHHLEHIARVEALSAAGSGDAGVYAQVNYHSARAARLAAGACLQAATDVLSARYHRAYCLVRPPGHHAEPDRAMALCLYNNVAIAARNAQRHGARRVLILDWDVHHGNGIQSVFAEDPDVLYISVHQDGLFPPASGTVSEMGVGPGVGTTFNVPAASRLGARRVPGRRQPHRPTGGAGVSPRPDLRRGWGRRQWARPDGTHDVHQPDLPRHDHVAVRPRGRAVRRAYRLRSRGRLLSLVSTDAGAEHRLGHRRGPPATGSVPALVGAPARPAPQAARRSGNPMA